MIKVLHFTTHNEECGIAKYNEQLISAMEQFSGEQVKNDFFEVSPNITRYMPSSEFKSTLEKLVQQMQDYDILHIQHELSFFKHDELREILNAVKNMGKKTIVTVHTAPDVQIRSERLGGVGPRSLLHLLKAKRFNRSFVNRYYSPLDAASLVLVPNNVTKESVLRQQPDISNIEIFTHHIPKIPFKLSTDEIHKKLSLKAGDKVFCTVGFLSDAKGIADAVKALNYLPKNYKLAIIGGSHPRGESHNYYNEIADLIVHYKLQDRVYITGYVKDDDQLNALIRECDICVYPYNTSYYGYVSSASLNNAIGNHKAVVTYPTRSFVEVNEHATKPALTICNSPNYYELAREIGSIDIKSAESASQDFALQQSVSKKAEELVRIYQSTL